jgi:hypothetical protein
MKAVSSGEVAEPIRDTCWVPTSVSMMFTVDLNTGVHRAGEHHVRVRHCKATYCYSAFTYVKLK